MLKFVHLFLYCLGMLPWGALGWLPFWHSTMTYIQLITYKLRVYSGCLVSTPCKDIHIILQKLQKLYLLDRGQPNPNLKILIFIWTDHNSFQFFREQSLWLNPKSISGPFNCYRASSPPIGTLSSECCLIAATKHF